MQNVQMKVDGNKLVVTVDLSKSFGPSKSGKTEMVASSHGNVAIPGTDVKMGLNIYRPL